MALERRRVGSIYIRPVELAVEKKTGIQYVNTQIHSVYKKIKCYKKTQIHKTPRTRRCWGVGWSTSRGSLTGGVPHSPLHGTGSLGSTVGVGRTGCPFQRLVQKERFLVHIIALTAAAVWVTRVIGLRVILWKEGRDTTRTLREKDNKGQENKKQNKKGSHI